MSTVKILLEVEIDNSSEWLGLTDYKQHEGVDSDLDAFEEMVKLEGTTPLNLVIALSDASTQSKFLAVEALEQQVCPVCNGKTVALSSMLSEKMELREAVSMIWKFSKNLPSDEKVFVIADNKKLPGINSTVVKQVFCSLFRLSDLQSAGIRVFDFNQKNWAGCNGHSIVLTSGEASKEALLISSGISIHKRWKNEIWDVKVD